MKEASHKKAPNNKRKFLVAGLSVTSISYLLFHIIHFVHSAEQLTGSENEIKFDDIQSVIILTDSVTGKKDTVSLLDYLEKKKSIKDTAAKKENTHSL
ncbi:hypothetical protein [Foetidibacter luteolus]|uniref:hypothetical protein n=1 Tax=Foetidibacter luteolus TaxID=2608880 RepID=UPI00129B1DB4|nr:hypothetical protein [Foetidibacter luteolus]